MKRLRTTLWLSFGLVSVTMCLALTAYVLGLMPDAYQTELDSRAKVAEALAVQLVGAANRNDDLTLEETLSSVVKRNADILSVAFRKTDGTTLLSQGDHERHWKDPPEGLSTPTHVVVPLVGEKGPQGKVEIAFGPPTSGERYFDIPMSMFVFLAFLAVAGFAVYTIFLRRTLHELDPGRVIPERVQKAFDTLSEGVIILDERERILLINEAFAKMFDGSGAPAIGSRINNLQWRMKDGSAKAGTYPWHTALHEERELRQDVLSLRTPAGAILNLNVNATVFRGEKQEKIGAIVTLTDMTSSKQNAEQLARAVELLKKTQGEVERQKQELDYLSNHDSLTGCMNRRAFFATFEAELDQARRRGSPIAILMLDIDNIRTIKENFGPAVSDGLITCLAGALRRTVPENATIARYGGEGFCVALFNAKREECMQLAEKVETAFSTTTQVNIPELERATIGTGMVLDEGDACSTTELVRRADQSLNAALKAGCGLTAYWSASRIMVNSARSSTGSPVSILATQQAGKLAEDIRPEQSQAQFLETVNQSIVHAERSDKPLAVLRVGITSWNYFEEALGEELSRTLLQLARRRIELALREHDNVFVLGDRGEMLVELAKLEEVDDVNWIARRILDALREPIKIGEQTTFVVCKIGAALFPHDGQDGATLMRHAGVAMRRAMEENLLAGLKFYAAEMTQNSFRSLEIETGIREALQNDDFELHFQPIVSAQTGKLTAAESLLRCTSSRLNGVRIDQIIEVAERTSLITEIDMWVVNAALNQMQAWCESGLDLPKISINISAKQLTNIEFVDRIFEKFETLPIPVSRVQIEVTETARMADVEVAAPQLKRLQQLGAHIALDDFGTGQASLTYLQRLHPDVIKIDRSFVDGVNKNHANATMVGAMTAMAHCLGLKVVVEGVETQEELEFLRETKCDEIQGYLVSKPLNASTMTQWMSLFIRKNGDSVEAVMSESASIAPSNAA